MAMQERTTYKISVRDKDYSPANNTSFNIKEINKSNLRDTVKEKNYSLITWKDNTRKAENFQYAVGCVIDIDNGLTVEKAQERLKKKGLNHFIVTSKRHTKEANRFHILVFFNYPVYCSSTYEKVIQDVTKIFPEADQAVLDPARFIFGSPDDCEIHEFWNGEDFDVSGYQGLWDHGTELLDKDDNKVELSEKMIKTPILCPFHNDIEPSAFVAFSGENYFISCSACQQTFWMAQNREEWLARKCRNFYSYGTDVFEFSIIGDSFAFNNIGRSKFHVLTDTGESKDLKDEAWNYLIKNKHISQICTIDYIGDIDADTSYYESDLVNGIFTVHHKALPVDIEDNDFIEEYLSDRFGDYKDFIKQWMAVYCYTNYKKLPTLVFSGGRGSGKSSFSEIVAKIYPSLYYRWSGSKESFTHEAEKKFLLVEENPGDKVSQYKSLKDYAGSEDATVRKLFKDPYLVKNNMNMCILSNETIPVFVRSEEQPEDSWNNQFFVYEFPALDGRPDAQIKNKVIERLGHYIRTELKTVFESLNLEGFRYSIDVPITEYEDALFINNKTEADYEIEDLIDDLIDEYSSGVITFQQYRIFVEHGFLPSEWIKEKHPYKSGLVIKNLKRRKYLEGNSIRHREGSFRKSCYVMTDKLKSLLEEETR
jgi:hypothetical protein